MTGRTVVVLALCAVALVGCTTTDSSPPATTTITTTTATAPTTTTAPRTTSQAPTPRPTVAPQVAEPLDLESLRDHPCTVLSAQQLAELGLYAPPKGAVNDEFGTCAWVRNEIEPTGYGYRLTINVTGDHLGAAYRDSNQTLGAPNHYQRYAVFEPRTISGFPAVVSTATDLATTCEVVVGTGNGQAIVMEGTVRPTNPDLCLSVVTAVEWVIEVARG